MSRNHGKSIRLSDDNCPSIIEDKIYYVQENFIGYNRLSKTTKGTYHGKSISLSDDIFPSIIEDKIDYVQGNVIGHNRLSKKLRANIMARAFVCQMAVVHRS